ncbi:hypothetical protein CTAM01_00191 [Colletotrichum tamarilloi]|uniref:PNPLA domain-containing protein n=1 Tax=Colletotrichum tamarilloi TaxID=1209934 RepID=A0ABQ9RTW1_9PEZI|nr:uncharacterized protein CTAM01_00191 [Colletotrichum tamarilloi]KAK1512796.1 hypothetical protein CTAM01_00191 [Colletotrichum tamarilloi]
MKRLQKVAGLRELPKPQDYFHLMGGTSRMGMSTEEAINAYESFAKDVFRKKNRRRWWNRTYKEETLVKIIQGNVTKKKLAKTTMLDDTRERGLAFVCAATYDAYEAYLFRTYKGSSNCAHNVEIWEAARATSAAPTFFHPISIEVEAERDQYVDGAVTCNNPARLVLSEAESYFVVARQGSGALFSRGTIKILKHAKASLTDSEPEHQALEQRFQKTHYAYWRLNLDRGAADIKLNEYKKMGLLRAATERYLQDIEVSTNIDKIVSMLHKKEGVDLSLDAACHAVSDAASKQALQQEVQINSIASPQFTGRLDILNKMERHFYERPSGSSPRRHLRIWGMGGIGKTQIALKFRDLFDRVFWINAATKDSIFESFRLLTAEIFDEEAGKPNIKRVQNWLAQNQTEEWLLVFDNNDTIDVSNYLPPGNTGNILFTSRRKDMSPILDANQTIPVDIMDAEDAVTLFLRASQRQQAKSEDDDDEKYGKAIVHELGYLPLAIDQAGSFVYIQECSFKDYLNNFQRRRKDILGDPPLYPGVFEHNPAVYGTFELSYDALKMQSVGKGRKGQAALNALRILNIFCFYHNENITTYILSRAATNKQMETTFISGEEGSIAPLPLLDLTEEGDWDSTNFNDGIAMLRSYSLIKNSLLYDESYSMHVLVHSWARDRMKPEMLVFQRRAAREILFFSVGRNNRLIEELFASQVLTHMQACLDQGGSEDIEWMRRTEQEGKFAQTLAYLGLWDKATAVLEQIVADRQEKLDCKDWANIAALWDLAKVYRHSSRLRESDRIFGLILKLLPECPDKTKVIRHNLNIQFDWLELLIVQAGYLQAKMLLETIMKIAKPQGWTSKWYHRGLASLATILRMEGDTETAVALEMEVYEHCIHDDKIEPGHRNMMTSMNNLAALHSEWGMHEEAHQLWCHFLSNEERLRGKENPITLQSKRNVATGCANLNRLKEAEEILREVLEVSERVLWRTHLDTLATMDQLAGVLARRGETEEATRLWEECLESWVGNLDKHHPLIMRTTKVLKRLKDDGAVLGLEDFQAGGIMRPSGWRFYSVKLELEFDTPVLKEIAAKTSDPKLHHRQHGIMRSASILRMASASVSKGNGLRPTPMALLPPIPLYRRLLRAHRKHLPSEMRVLGDEYIKAEFRAHRTVDNPAHLIGFLTEWQLYAQKIEGNSWVGEKIDPVKVAKMSDEQIGQLYELMQAIKERRESGEGEDQS